MPSSQPSQRDEQGSVTKRRKLGGTFYISIVLSSANVSIVANVPSLPQPQSTTSPTQARPRATEQDDTVEADTSGAPKHLQGSGEKKRKKRKSIGVIPKTRRKSTAIAQEEPHTAEPSISIEKNTLGSQLSPTDNTARGRGRPRKSLPAVVELQEEEMDHQESAAELAKSKMRGRPRKSLPIVDGNPEHSQITTDSPKSKPRGRPRKSLPVVEEDEDEEAERLETINDSPKSRPRGRPRKSDAPLDVIEETQPIRASQAPTKKTNNKPRHSRASSDTNESASRKPLAHADSIPITVHRLSHLRALVFEDDDQDILAGPAPFPKKSGVNAIDVLSQICREMIAKSVDTLQRGAQNEGHEGRKAEWKRKRKAVEMFGNELDGRLFQMVHPFCFYETMRNV